MKAESPTHSSGIRKRPPGGNRLRTARMLVYLSWRNLWRNPWRSLLTAGAMVVGLTLMIAYLALMEGMFRQMVGFATNIALSHVQIHRDEFVNNQDPYALLPWELVEHLREESSFRFAPRAYAAGLGSAGNYSAGVLIKAVDPALEPKVTDLHRRIRQGRFALETTGQARPGGPGTDPVPVFPVVIGHRLAKVLQVEVGGEMVLISQALDGSIGNGLFEVRGILAPIDPAFDRMGVVMSLEAFRELMALEGGVHELAVVVPDVALLDEAKALLATAVEQWPGIGELPADGGGPVLVRTWKEINPALNDMIVSSRSFVYVMAVIVFLVAAMGILNTMLMAVHERRQELGLLRALGMGRGALMAMVLLEAFFLSCFAGTAGTAVGVMLAWYLNVAGFDYSAWLPDGMDFMGVMLDPVFYGHLLPEHVWVSVAMMVATAMVAALLPSWRTARLDPVRALHR